MTWGRCKHTETSFSTLTTSSRWSSSRQIDTSSWKMKDLFWDWFLLQLNTGGPRYSRTWTLLYSSSSQPGCRGTFGCPEKFLGVLRISELCVYLLVNCNQPKKGAANQNRLRNTGVISTRLHLFPITLAWDNMILWKDSFRMAWQSANDEIVFAFLQFCLTMWRKETRKSLFLFQFRDWTRKSLDLGISQPSQH